MIGRTLGRYRIVEKLGAGGMGEVYRAHGLARLRIDTSPSVLTSRCARIQRRPPGGRAMRILVVEDDKKTATFIVKGLQRAGYAVDHAGNGEDGLHLALTEPYDAAVVDIMLPKGDGLSLVEELRRKKINTPVVILSAKRSVNDRVRGLQSGGDDYLTKPFSFAELLARLRALIRRASGTAEPTRLQVGPLSMDLLSRKVARGDTPLDLQPREFALLEYLMRHAGEIVSKTMILENIWDYDFEPQTNVVDVLLCRLRKKLDTETGEPLIHTVRGVGYVLKGARP